MSSSDSSEFPTEAAHLCEGGERLQRETRGVQDAETPEALWGHAVTHVGYAAGRWWAHNGEYASIIRFCPWCGADLEAAAPS